MTKSRSTRQTGRQTANARRLRRTMSDAEHLLCSRLREARDAGVAFRRQVPIGPYVAGFMCRKADLIVEVDGEQHALPEQAAYDERRNAFLRGQGYTVVRVWTADIWRDVDAVLDRIDGEVQAAGAL